jgi:hypothetical protein
MTAIAQVIKDRAYIIDPAAWKSYSGKPPVTKRRLEARRVLSLNLARQELGMENDRSVPFSSDDVHEDDTAIRALAREIDPACWKSYRGSDRRDAQQASLDEARRRLASAPAAEECGLGYEAAHKAAADTETRWMFRYSVADIDRMRIAIERNPMLVERITPWDKPFHFSNRPARVEGLLRTYMLNGTTPDELEKAADEAREKSRMEREVRRAAHYARVAAAEADGGVRAAIQAELSAETPHVTAAGLTFDLPLPTTLRTRLRERIESAIKDILMRLK